MGKRMLSHTGPGRYVTGSDSRAFVRLEASNQPGINPDDIDWCEISGDPEAGRIPRRWDTVAVLATSHSIYNGIDPEYLREPGQVKDAIAWISEGIVRVGVSPDSDNLFGGTVIEGESRFVVAKRRSANPVEATLGLWVPAERRFIEAPQTSVVDGSLPLDGLAEQAQYRHMSVV